MYHRVKVNIPTWFLLLATAFSLFFLTEVPSAHAQFLDGSTGLTLVTNPTIPLPGAPFEVSLNDYSVDAIGATITWYVNGSEQTQFKNERTIKLESGSLGTKIVVRALLTRNNAPTLSSSVTITPAVVDIILEAETYVPVFYKGRALPSGDSAMRAIAVVHDGTNLSDTAYTYKWSENGTVLIGGPTKGKNVIDLTLSRYGRRDIAVEVTNPSGEIVGRKIVEIRAVEPEIHFYEESPLRGLSEKEITIPFPLISEEVTIYGEPYFVNARMAGGEVGFGWKINGEPTTSDTETPNAITLRRVGGEGEAYIDLRVLTTKRIPQLIEKTFQVFF